MDKNILLSITIIGLGVFGIFAFHMSQGQAAPTEVTGGVVAGEFQSATLSFQNYQYVIDPPNLQAGVPVRMAVDLTSVVGCMRDVVIPEFGIRQRVSAGNNIIEFTPSKAGTFNIACSMNMGRGSFSVQ